MIASGSDVRVSSIANRQRVCDTHRNHVNRLIGKPPVFADLTSSNNHLLECLPSYTHNRRQLLQLPCLMGLTFIGGALAAQQTAAASLTQLLSTEAIQDKARERYAQKDFPSTIQLLNELVDREPQISKWREMRAQVRVDAKDFKGALQDFNTALGLTPGDELITRARLLSGRALTFEGLSDWKGALRDYTTALELASEGGSSADPYVLNSRGNVYASLKQWAEAREDYLASAELFQRAKGFRGQGGSTTLRLDGAVFAASNAALMLVQLGNEEQGLREMQRIARRAPGSVDMRAALAALYWAQGSQSAAESEWQFACDKIAVGCLKYQDKDWLSRIRRWPPIMVDKMQDFLNFKPTGDVVTAAPALIE